MNDVRYYAIPGAPGFGWHVAESVGDGARVVAGPYTTLAEAHNAALRMNDRKTPEPVDDPGRSPERALLAAIGDTLRSLALQADRYDAVIADLRTLVVERTGAGTGLDPSRLDAIETTVRAMSERLDALETMIDDATGSHSVKV